MDELKVGAAVVYHDEHGNPHNALLTSVWGKREDAPAVNLVFVSGDEAEHDNYGRQTKRESSVTHVSRTNVHGRYWRFADETPRPYVAPASV